MALLFFTPHRRWIAPVSALALLCLIVLFPTAAAQDATEASPRPVPIYLFWGDGCPHCAREEAFLDDLLARRPELELHAFEVWYDIDNRELMHALAAAYGREATAVPVTFIGDEMWTGFSDGVARSMIRSIDQYARYGGPDPAARLEGSWREVLAPTPLPGDTSLTLPLVGAVDLASRSLLLSTGLIALADGFNPCSLWVLSLLLAVVINTRSRRRVVLVGLTFLGVATLAYALFIAGLFSVFAYVQFLPWIRVAIAALAIAFAAINLKDYFFYRQGPSLTIGEAHKPRIYRGIRGVVNARAGLGATAGATAALALGVTLIELPCTAGLPLLWTSLVADAGVGAAAFVLLLALYMLVFLLDELLVFGLVAVTMRAARVDERGGRVLKLIGGAIMLALGLAMLAVPEAMNSVTGSLIVFGGAVVASALVLVLHRWLNPASSPLPARHGARHPTRQ